jgi:hypothetical protein
MNDNEKQPVNTTDYHAYLLRIWRETENDWRFSLQATNTEERVGFTNLQSALNFIEQKIKNKECKP